MTYAKLSAAKTFLVGPILDVSGIPKTDEVVANIKVTKNGTVGSPNGASTLTHNHSGKYLYAANAADFDTLGEVAFSLNDGNNDMVPVVFQVLPATTYDAIVINAAGGANGLPMSAANNKVAATVATGDMMEWADGGRLDLILDSRAASSEVVAIQNNTRVRVIIPAVIERPDSDSTAYRLDIYIYDEVGNNEAPDALPTITAANQTGTSRAANLGTVTLESVGHYSVTYTVASTHAIEQVHFEWSIVEGGATRLHGGLAQVVDTTAVDFTAADRTKLETLATDYTTTRAGKLDNLDATISSRGTSTLAAGAKMDLVDAPNATALTAIGAKVETMVLDEGDATALLAAIAAKVEAFVNDDGDAAATLTAIATAVNTALATAHGSGSWNTATGFAVPGSTMTLTSEERTTLTAAFWAALVSSFTTAGSIGKWLLDSLLLRATWTDTRAGKLDNLDAKVSEAGDVSVTVSPVSISVSPGQASAHATLCAYQYTTLNYSLTIRDLTGADVVLTGKSLRMQFFSGNDPANELFAIVTSGAAGNRLVISGGNCVAVEGPATITAAVRDMRWRLLNVTNNRIVGTGLIKIEAGPNIPDA